MSRPGRGFLYLAMVLDVFSRRVVGWAMETHLRTELILAALNMAITQRRPEAVIHHSDRGCQYTSYAFGKRCREAGVMPSMGSVGDAYDNAMAESFFASLERELLNRRRFKSQAEAKMAVFEWIEGWYNPHRRHSSLVPLAGELRASSRGKARGMIMNQNRCSVEFVGIPTPGVERDLGSWSSIRSRFSADRRKNPPRASAACGGRLRMGCKIDGEKIKERRRETVHRSGAGPFRTSLGIAVLIITAVVLLCALRCPAPIPRTRCVDRDRSRWQRLRGHRRALP